MLLSNHQTEPDPLVARMVFRKKGFEDLFQKLTAVAGYRCDQKERHPTRKTSRFYWYFPVSISILCVGPRVVWDRCLTYRRTHLNMNKLQIK